MEEQRRAVFIDVLPHAPRPANLPAGTLWRDKPRLEHSRQLWLPDTGYGALAPATEDYLRLACADTGGDRAKPLVIYCLRDCWMSWNAAKRALSIGYAMSPGIPTEPTAGTRPRLAARGSAAGAAAERLNLIPSIVGSRGRARTGAAR